jgi:hypothetical protein
MAVLAENTHPLQNRAQYPHKAKYIILGSPGQLSRPAVWVPSMSGGCIFKTWTPACAGVTAPNGSLVILAKAGIHSHSQLYLCGTLLQLLLGVCTSIHFWEIIRSSASLLAGLR